MATEWMDAGYFGLGDAHVAGWPLSPWQWELEQLPMWHGVSGPLHLTFLVFGIFLEVFGIFWDFFLKFCWDFF